MKAICTVLNLLLILFNTIAHGEERIPDFAKKYPDGLLTPDYGIVTEEDLAINAWRSKPVPYNPKETVDAYIRWQCFPISSIEPKVHTWEGEDGMDSSLYTFTMCSLAIWVKHQGEMQVFGERRAYKAARCWEFMKNWKRLTKNESIACLSGESGGLDEESVNGVKTKVKHWTWDMVKTKKGCISYFSGDCDIANWKKEGYLNGKIR